MNFLPRPAERVLWWPIARLDALFDRLYGWRHNPLYQSGTIAIFLLAVLIATGLWLIFFYRVGAPYQSVVRITEDPWVGNWVRGAHRYASDALIVVTVIHMARMFAQGRSWGARTRAWVSGVLLLALIIVCGITGFVMVWDTFGQLLAIEGARMIDSLPILSEPVGRAFTGEQELLEAFFFLNLFLHIAIPLGLALLLWVHLSRVARPAMLPPKRLMWAIALLLIAVSVAWPIGMAPAAHALRLPEEVPISVFYGFWVPLTTALPAGVALAGVVGAWILLLLVPAFTRRRGAAAPPASMVDEELCTGCTQCSLDCPYDAISMIPRSDGRRSELVARVDPAMCVSCGICSGSCPPMGVGPPGRTGRDQLVQVRTFLAGEHLERGQVVAISCIRGERKWGPALRDAGAQVQSADCIGNVHTSAVEALIRGGAGGVLLVTCPPRDCWNREGPKWLHERLYNEREAELKERVDRRRVAVVRSNTVSSREVASAARAFVESVARLESGEPETAVELDTECEVVPVKEDG
jgi:ferredoxin